MFWKIKHTKIREYCCRGYYSCYYNSTAKYGWSLKCIARACIVPTAQSQTSNLYDLFTESVHVCMLTPPRSATQFFIKAASCSLTAGKCLQTLQVNVLIQMKLNTGNDCSNKELLFLKKVEMLMCSY